MIKSKLTNNIPLFVIIIVNAVFILTIFSLMNYAQFLLKSDIETNLTEIVNQNREIINSNLSNEVNQLSLYSTQLAERFNFHDKSYEEIFIDFANEKNDIRLFFALSNGSSYFPDGSTLDISGRNYFRLSLDGESNISNRLISRLDGESLFIMSAPIVMNNEVVATIQKQYTPDQMYTLSSSYLYSDQGYTYIINKEGYIVIGSQDEGYTPESDNLFRLLYANNPEQARILKEDIQNDKTGFMELNYKERDIYSTYTPLDKIYDWYLVSSIQKDAVLPNVQSVIKIFIIVLLFLTLGFLISSSYFLYSKKRREKLLRKLAFIDPVTGLDTFTKFQYDFQQVLSSNSKMKFYIFVFDVDNFKYINNYYGYERGDHILSVIHQLFTSSLLVSERCARVYSDHFVMLLHDVSKERLASLFSSEITIDNIVLYLSAGIYEVTDLNENINLMVDKANMASQSDKGTHHKEVNFFSHQLNERLIENEQTKRAIEQAIKESEFIPFYQPKINIETGQLDGAEALARWIRKDGTIIQPSEFIPIAEKTGLIKEIDFIIFEKTLQFIEKMTNKGIQCVPISINFSRIHLLNRDFIPFILSKIEQYNISTNLIEIELTETTIFDNYQLMENFIHQLHSYGFLISMDDFGSGYSSLNMLKDVNIDIIKFDRGFLQDTKESNRQLIILSAITKMATELGIKIIVEGVETEDNVALMREYGLKIAQGYYYSRPISSEQFEVIYTKGKLQ